MKRTFSLLLAVLMLFGAVALCSCGTKKTNEEQTTVDTGEQQTHESDSEWALYPVEVKDLDNYEYRIVGVSGLDAYEYFDAETLNVDVVSDEVFRRNRKVEDDYNITISTKFDAPYKEFGSTITNSLTTQTDFADLVVHMARYFTPIVSALYDLNTIESLRLERSWWDQEAIKTFTVNNKLIFATGDIETNDEMHLISLLYNQDLFSNYFPDKSVYDTVREGNWTFEEFWSYVKGFGRDLNENGKLDESDLVGLQLDDGTLLNMLDAFEMPPVTFNGTAAEVHLSSPEFEQAFSTFSSLVTNTDDVVNRASVAGSYGGAAIQFCGGGALFSTCTTFDIPSKFLDAPITWSVLPFPKYKAEQAAYHNTIHAFFEPVAIPKTVSAANLEKVGLITEALAFNSSKVRDQLYNVVFPGKLAQNPDGYEMLNLVYSSKGYSFDYIANVAGLVEVFAGYTNNHKVDSFTSDMKGMVPAVKQEYKTYLRSFK